MSKNRLLAFRNLLTNRWAFKISNYLRLVHKLNWTFKTNCLPSRWLRLPRCQSSSYKTRPNGDSSRISLILTGFSQVEQKIPKSHRLPRRKNQHHLPRFRKSRRSNRRKRLSRSRPRMMQKKKSLRLRLRSRKNRKRAKLVQPR